MTTLVRELVDSPIAAEAIPATLAPLSDADAGAAWVKVVTLEGLVGWMKSSLRERAMVRGLPLPDGSLLAPCESRPKTILLERALPILRARFGTQPDALVKRSLGVEDVNKLFRQSCPAGKGRGKTIESLWAELIAQGGAKEASVIQLRVRKPRAAKDAATPDDTTNDNMEAAQ
jgi:hypothetical protein